MTVTERAALEIRLPDWVPAAARNYLVHTETGLSIRALARASDCHASTILRQVRRFENRRDDPLVDDVLRDLSRHVPRRLDHSSKDQTVKHVEIKVTTPENNAELTEARVEREGMRVLMDMCRPGSVLAVARDMEMAVVVRETPDGRTERSGVTTRPIAQAMALRDWISCTDPNARIARYSITSVGRARVKREMTAQKKPGFEDAQTPFAGQHQDWGDREVEDGPTLRHMRTNMAESPLTALARRRDKDGKPFLSRELVLAGERLREDFELANMGPRTTQNWDKFLTGPDKVQPTGYEGGSSAARDRVAAALADLGPGLGDAALRCCCFLEGLETTERKMGWAARSGKIVLRIALQRLRRHYDMQGKFAPKIG
jgi:hypothetical protein